MQVGPPGTQQAALGTSERRHRGGLGRDRERQPSPVEMTEGCYGSDEAGPIGGDERADQAHGERDCPYPAPAASSHPIVPRLRRRIHEARVVQISYLPARRDSELAEDVA